VTVLVLAVPHGTGRRPAGTGIGVGATRDRARREVLTGLFDLRRAPSVSSLTIGGCAGCSATVRGAGSCPGSGTRRPAFRVIRSVTEALAARNPIAGQHAPSRWASRLSRRTSKAPRAWAMTRRSGMHTEPDGPGRSSLPSVTASLAGRAGSPCGGGGQRPATTGAGPTAGCGLAQLAGRAVGATFVDASVFPLVRPLLAPRSGSCVRPQKISSQTRADIPGAHVVRFDQAGTIAEAWGFVAGQEKHNQLLRG
jgi:hypothetical protein